MAHTNRVANGIFREFVPEALMGAFVVFHFTGMFGTSEAMAESLGNMLKMRSKKYSTARVTSSTLLKSHGVTGSPCDDPFITMCWGRLFGAAQFPFFTSQKARKRRQGRGLRAADSRTVRRHIEKWMKSTPHLRSLRLSSKMQQKSLATCLNTNLPRDAS